jgi:hypothetical protein
MIKHKRETEPLLRVRGKDCSRIKQEENKCYGNEKNFRPTWKIS